MGGAGSGGGTPATGAFEALPELLNNENFQP